MKKEYQPLLLTVTEWKEEVFLFTSPGYGSDFDDDYGNDIWG